MATTITSYLTTDDVAAAYRSPQQLIELLDDPVNPAGVLNVTILGSIVARVNGVMASYLSRRVQLPLVVDDADAATVRAALLGAAMVLFRFYAMEDKPHLLDAFKALNDNYKNAIKWLEGVRDGVNFVGTSKTVSGAEARTEGTLSGTHEGMMSRERLRGW